MTDQLRVIVRKLNKIIPIAIISIVSILALIGGIWLAGRMNQVASNAQVSSKILSGDFDNMLRQKCIERLKSYDIGPVTEGNINLCVDTAKAIAYKELNK